MQIGRKYDSVSVYLHSVVLMTSDRDDSVEWSRVS